MLGDNRSRLAVYLPTLSPGSCSFLPSVPAPSCALLPLLPLPLSAPHCAVNQKTATTIYSWEDGEDVTLKHYLNWLLGNGRQTTKSLLSSDGEIITYQPHFFRTVFETEGGRLSLRDSKENDHQLLLLLLLWLLLGVLRIIWTPLKRV